MTMIKPHTPSGADSLSLAEKLGATAAALEDERRQALDVEPPDPAIAAAARLLGMKIREILAVTDTPDGIVVQTIGGGPPMIVVPSDQADRNGRHGIMWLYPPEGHTDVPIFNEEATIVDDVELRSVVPSDATDLVPLPVSLELDYLQRVLEMYEADPQMREKASNMPAAIRKLIAAERARLFAALPPPPPTSEEIGRWVAVAAWARARLDAPDMRQAEAANTKYGPLMPRSFQTSWWKFSEFGLANELSCALRWLQQHGFDAEGGPLGVVEKPKRRRRVKTASS